MSASTQRQVLFFALIGVCAALTHLIVLILLVKQFHFQPLWANPIAFLCAFCVSFYGHMSWTFRTQRSDTRWLSSLWRWLLSSVGGFFLNQFLFVLGLKWLGSDRYVYIWFAVTAFVTLISFVLAKFWAFSSPDRTRLKQHHEKNYD